MCGCGGNGRIQIPMSGPNRNRLGARRPLNQMQLRQLLLRRRRGGVIIRRF